jgi:hypothetical protein
MKMDTQQIEIIGKHILIANLLAANLEVAEPIRDHGIDLIVFRDGSHDSKFIACPIQLKTATDEAFELFSKYGRFPDLRIVYVWNVRNPKDAEFYCLTYAEAIGLLKSLKQEKFSFFEEHKYWYTGKPSKELKEMLREYQVRMPEDWPRRFGMTKSSANVSETDVTLR